MKGKLKLKINPIKYVIPESLKVSHSLYMYPCKRLAAWLACGVTLGPEGIFANVATFGSQASEPMRNKFKMAQKPNYKWGYIYNP